MHNVLTKIGNREAIPVRAVPFATHFHIDAKGLAGLLYENNLYYDGQAKVEAHEIKLAQLRKQKRVLYAYYIHEGDVKKIEPVDWHEIFLDLKALQEELCNYDKNHKTNSRKKWQERSTTLLPAGVFLWKDDFEAMWGSLITTDCADEDDLSISLLNETEGERQVNYFPRLESKWIATAVIEGFNAVTASRASTTPQKRKEVYLRDLHYLVGHPGQPSLTHYASSEYVFVGISITESGIYLDESQEFKDFLNQQLPEEADKWLYEILPPNYAYKPGQPLLTFPCSITDLRKLLDDIGESGSIHEERASEYEERALSKGSVPETKTRTRRDPLAIEMVEIVATFQKTGERVQFPLVLRELVSRVSDKSSCIVANTAGGLKWENSSGDQVEISNEAIRKRLSYILKK